MIKIANIVAILIIPLLDLDPRRLGADVSRHGALAEAGAGTGPTRAACLVRSREAAYDPAAWSRAVPLEAAGWNSPGESRMMRDLRRGCARMGVAARAAGLATGAQRRRERRRRRRRANGPDPALVQKLKDKARGSVAISTKQATKYVGFVRAGRNGDLLPRQARASPKAKATRLPRASTAHSSASRRESHARRRSTSTTDALGATHVTYEQRLQRRAGLRRRRSRRTSTRPGT